MEAICTPDMEARRRRLEELFADEPYLSATMKASRLHEREPLPAPAARDYPLPPVSPSPPLEAKVTRLGFVVNVRQEAEGLRAEVKGEDAADVMTAAEAARFLRVGEGTLRRWVREMGLPSAQMGRSRRFRKSALMRWLRAREGAR